MEYPSLCSLADPGTDPRELLATPTSVAGGDFASGEQLENVPITIPGTK